MALGGENRILYSGFPLILKACKIIICIDHQEKSIYYLLISKDMEKSIDRTNMKKEGAVALSKFRTALCI